MIENPFYGRETQGEFKLYELGNLILESGETLRGTKMAYRTFGKLTLKGQVGWAPNDAGAGPAWHFKAQAAYRLAPWLTLSGGVGRYQKRRVANYDHWDIGATASWRRLSLDARWGGTDQPLQQCFFTDWCKPGVYAAVSYRLLP